MGLVPRWVYFVELWFQGHDRDLDFSLFVASEGLDEVRNDLRLNQDWQLIEIERALSMREVEL
jgi:hypothetical protein